jgi:hypothetical protein
VQRRSMRREPFPSLVIESRTLPVFQPAVRIRYINAVNIIRY